MKKERINFMKKTKRQYKTNKQLINNTMIKLFRYLYLEYPAYHHKHIKTMTAYFNLDNLIKPDYKTLDNSQ